MAFNQGQLFEYTFVVVLNEISLEVDKPTESIIKFQCDDLFSTKELQYSWLKKGFCHDSKEIPGQDQYIISRMKESEVKKSLDKEFLNIRIFDKDVNFGNASVDLSPFF